MCSRVGSAFLVFVIFLVAALLALWPWPIDMWSQAAAGDAGVGAWDYWWVARSVMSLDNPWWTWSIFSPIGTELFGHGQLLVPGLLAAPATWVLGAPLAYNLSLPIWLALASLFSFLLARDMLIRPTPAFVVGLAYGLAPALTFRATGHLGLVAGFAVFPAVVLIARRAVRRPDASRFVALGGACAGLIYTDRLSAAYTLPVVLAVVVHGALTRGWWKSRRAIASLGLGVATSAVLLAPYLLASSRSAADYSPDPSVIVADARRYNADLFDFLWPSTGSAYLADIGNSARNGWAQVDYLMDGFVSFSIVTMILAAVGIASSWRQARTRWLVVWALIACLLAMGPIVRLAGDQYTPLGVDVQGFELSALMPFTWLVQLPVVGELRIPQRFGLLALLPLALLAGLGVAWLLKHVRRRSAHLLVVAILVAGIIVQGAVRMQPGMPIVDPVIYEPIRADQSSSTVVDVPLGWQTGVGAVGATGTPAKAMLRATQHNHPIAAGYISRLDPDRFAALGQIPFYASLLARQNGQSSGTDPAALVAARESAVQIGVGWAVVWPEAPAGMITYLLDVGFVKVRTHGDITLMRLGSQDRKASPAR